MHAGCDIYAQHMNLQLASMGFFLLRWHGSPLQNNSSACFTCKQGSIPLPYYYWYHAIPLRTCRCLPLQRNSICELRDFITTNKRDYIAAGECGPCTKQQCLSTA